MNNTFVKLIIITFLFLPKIILAGDSNVLKQRLEYLKDIPEISCVEFDDNDVYIGFSTRPLDLRIIVNAAAVHGNNAYGSGVHVWAVNASQKGWRPGDGSYCCTATARGGRIKKSDCK